MSSAAMLDLFAPLMLAVGDATGAVPTLASAVRFETVALGALLGLARQGLRIIPGMRKTAQEARDNNRHLADEFCAMELWLSLAYGAAAGIAAALAVTPLASGGVDGETALQLLAAGYVGSDFIAGLVGRLNPAKPGSNNDDPAKKDAAAKDVTGNQKTPQAPVVDGGGPASQIPQL